MKIKGKFFLSNQECFDAAWTWLVVEDRPKCSVDSRCLYRKETEVGVETCVVGAFISDDIIRKFESTRGEFNGVIGFLISLDEDLREWFRNVDKDLLRSVQRVHDFDAVHSRRTRLVEIASLWNLTVPE